MPRRIVYTRPDCRVGVLVPAPEWLAGVTGVGGLIEREQSVEQILLHMVPKAEGGLGLSAAQAIYYVNSCVNGGLAPKDAYALLVMRDVPTDCSGVEIWHTEDVPADRWFRDAWRRAPEGGPIHIDLDAARAIQAKRIVAMRRATIARLEDDSDMAALMTIGGNVVPFLLDAWRGLPMDTIGKRLAAAASADELRRILDIEAMEIDPTQILDWRLEA